MDFNLSLQHVGKVTSEMSLGSPRIMMTERKSAAFIHPETPSAIPQAHASFDGRFLQCNTLFSDFTAIPQHMLKTLTILSIVKFESFEGPQTASYLFDELAKKASYNDKNPPEFLWSAPLGSVRDGLLEKSMDIIVSSNRDMIDGQYCLSVRLTASKKPCRSNSISRHATMNMSYGSLKQVEVLESSSIKKYKVLVVDESLATLQHIQRQISMTGHEVDVEQDHDEAGDCLKRGSYDVAVFEIGLAHHGGLMGSKIAHEWRLYEHLHRSSDKPLIIIATSSDYDDSMFMEALNAGFDGYILKPFSVEDFLSIILMIDDSRRGK